MYEQAQSKRIVTKIDANPLLQKRNAENGVLRVAAYCRVSTDSEDQIESYNAQVAHYTEAIMKNPKWRFVKIYADEGITGTLAKKREQFIKMIRDCEKGKIDLILTKSFSRFARNTVDSLRYVRKLKALGIGVFFEEQNLNSLTADSKINTELCFSQYDDIMIRRLVGLIRVTKDKSIVIYLKGGLSVTEAVE